VIDLLSKNPLLLLFVVAAAGILVGRLKIRGFGLGVAAVLFVGLGIGGLDPRLKLPELVQQFGLVLFVYAVGVGSGPGFFSSLRRRGLRGNALTVGALLVGALLVAGLARALGIGGAKAAGVFAGATTNTPALAGVIESLDASRAAQPVIGYSVAYPFGVLGVLLVIFFARRMFRVEYDREPVSVTDVTTVGQHIESATVRVERDLPRAAARDLGLRVQFGRMRRGGVLSVATEAAILEKGDLVSVVGAREDIDAAAAKLGTLTSERLDLDRSVVDYRRVFVSSHDVAERPLSALRISERFGAVVTRVRRGDIEFVPDGKTELELGDRVRVVAPREHMDAVSRYFGDSYKALGEIDVITFGLGIAAGLLLGIVPVPLPGGPAFKLGLAGGPLIVGLVLGRIGRTGPLVWSMPYSANLLLRQLGAVLFLAGVGTRSGWSFVATSGQGGALPLVLVGAAVTVVVALGALVVGRKLLRIPMGVLVGVISGIQTQPADLAFALEQTKSETPTVGYTTVYPLATISKIVLAQLIAWLA
jgi:putative transport protein